MIRWRVVFLLVAVVTAAIWFAPSSKEVVKSALPRADITGKESSTTLAAVPDLSRATPTFERAAARLLPSEPAVKPAAGPQQPALPEGLTVVGKAHVDGELKAIVSFAGKTHLAGVGSRIEDRFVVERIEEAAVVLVDLDQGRHAFTLTIGAVR